MILPNKTIDFSDSILGLGSVVLSGINSSTTVTALWDRLQRENPGVSFEKFILTIDFLFALGLVQLKDGLLRRTRE